MAYKGITISTGGSPASLADGPAANTAGLAAFNTAAAAIIAITGDTYSTTTKQFTFGGATGLTHAQWATVGALINTAMASFVAEAPGSGDVVLYVSTSMTRNAFIVALGKIVSYITGSLKLLTE